MREVRDTKPNKSASRSLRPRGKIMDWISVIDFRIWKLRTFDDGDGSSVLLSCDLGVGGVKWTTTLASKSVPHHPP